MLLLLLRTVLGFVLATPQTRTLAVEADDRTLAVEQ
jgi:hypothetical protein